jgi:hypothetical protein
VIVTLTAYRCLLCLYPKSYRHEFGEEMKSVFREAQSDVPAAPAAKISFYLREFCGLLSGALRAHFDRLFGPGIPFPRFHMQSQFRFPRSTVFLMLVILAGVVLAIEQAKTIVKYGPHQVTSAWRLTPWFIFLFPALAFAAVAAVWGLLFALRRTGMHRLDGIQTSPENSNPTLPGKTGL